MKSVRCWLTFLSVVCLSGCAGFGFQDFKPATPAVASISFIDRFPENLQGVVILRPLDAKAILDYHSSVWEGESGRYNIRMTGAKKSPYVALMLPPGRYTLRRLDSYNYWLDLSKAVIRSNGESYLGEPSFEVVSGQVSYLGDVEVSSSSIRGLRPSFSGNKVITEVKVDNAFDDAALFVSENYPNLVQYMKVDLISASGDAIRLEEKQ